MPAYNEPATIEKIVKEVAESPWLAELLIVDDGSTDFNVTDMERCYEAFRRDVIQSIPLREDRFGFEPEV